MIPQTAPLAADLPGLHAGFLSILPTVERHAWFAFRHWHGAHDREDAVAETVAVAWAWYVRLMRRGKDPTAFPSALASYASRHVKSGRRLCGTESTRDALSPTARQRRGFSVQPLRTAGRPDEPTWQEALIDNTQSAVPEQVAFRVDFPDWLATLGDRDRGLAEAMALEHRTLDLAQDFGVSPGRVSQLRRDFRRSWQRFHAETAMVSPGDAVTAA
jgi:hypothetical protein